MWPKHRLGRMPPSELDEESAGMIPPSVVKYAAMNAATSNSAAHLSNRHQDILRRLLADAQHVEATQPSDALTSHGMAVRSLRGPGPKSAADSASFTRAIRHLSGRTSTDRERLHAFLPDATG